MCAKPLAQDPAFTLGGFLDFYRFLHRLLPTRASLQKGPFFYYPCINPSVFVSFKYHAKEALCENKEAHFTIAQKVIFDLLLADATIDDDNIELLGISRTKYYKTKREVYDKLMRIEPKLSTKLT